VKKIAIILNGLSLKKEHFYNRILPELSKDFKTEVWETRTQQDGIALAGKAVEKRFDAVLAAGGDGTLNEVVNGILSGNEHLRNLPAAGVIPLGSGNDFTRTVGLTGDVQKLKNLLQTFRPKPVDVGKINFIARPNTPPRYFLNIADVGMGPIVVKRVLESGRPFGSVVQYYTAIIHTFFTYRLTGVRARTALWNWDGKIRVMAIANGKYFGNGICISPEAIPDDGQFSCFIAGNVSVLDFIIQNGRLRSGKRPIHNHIEYKEADSIELHADVAMPIEADGELVGELPVRVDMLHRKLPFLW
jgi:diacylglycerol kinase (ATP)